MEIMEQLSKREYIALEITKAIISAYPENYLVNGGYMACNPLVDDAYRIADELIRQSNTGK